MSQLLVIMFIITLFIFLYLLVSWRRLIRKERESQNATEDRGSETEEVMVLVEGNVEEFASPPLPTPVPKPPRKKFREYLGEMSRKAYLHLLPFFARLGEYLIGSWKRAQTTMRGIWSFIRKKTLTFKLSKRQLVRLRRSWRKVQKNKLLVFQALLGLALVLFVLWAISKWALPVLDKFPVTPAPSGLPSPAPIPSGLSISEKVFGLVVFAIVFTALFWKKIKEKGRLALKSIPSSIIAGPVAAARWSFVTGPAYLGRFFWIPQIRYLWITGLLISAIVLLPALVFFPWGWDNVWGKPVIFWGFTLGLLFVIWFAFAFHDKKWGKWVATVLGVIVVLGLINQVRDTTTYKEWKKANEASAVASATVSRPVELPRGTLMMEAEKEPGLMEKTGWPEEHVLEARNVIIDEFDLPSQFDIWDDKIGKCGEFRWNKYAKRGTYCLAFPTEKGEWVLKSTGITNEFSGWCFFVRKGEKLKVPVKFFVER